MTICQKDAFAIILDFETSGTDFLNDQIHSVYASVVNEDGIELNSFQAQCRSESFRLTNPEALLVNGISNETLFNGDHPLDVHMQLKDFIQKYPEIPIIAFNAAFDFKFGFQGLFQACDPDPYFWKKGRKVICAMHLVRSQYMNDPDALIIPKISGGLSFRQEDIATANGIYFPRHQAKGDVQTLRAIMQKVKLSSPDLIKKAKFFGNRANTESFLHRKKFVVVPTGWKSDFSVRCIVPLAFDANQKNFLGFDIGMLDPRELPLDEEFPAFSATYVASGIAKRNIDSKFPFVKLPLNQSIIFEDEEMWRASEPSADITYEILCERAAAARSNGALLELTQTAMHFDQNRFDDDESEQLESRLFEGFTSAVEKNFLYSMFSLPLEVRFDYLIENKEFSNNRYHKLARRYLLDKFPELCPLKELNRFKEWRLNRLTSGPAKHTTFMKAKKQLNNLHKKYPDEQSRLEEIKDYLDLKLDMVSLDYSDL